MGVVLRVWGGAEHGQLTQKSFQWMNSFLPRKIVRKVHFPQRNSDWSFPVGGKMRHGTLETPNEAIFIFLILRDKLGDLLPTSIVLPFCSPIQRYFVTGQRQLEDVWQEATTSLSSEVV